MHTDKKIFILIPAYNEETKIGNVILDLKTNRYNNILVVNDGSNDRTAEIARKAGAKVTIISGLYVSRRYSIPVRSAAPWPLFII